MPGGAWRSPEVARRWQEIAWRSPEVPGGCLEVAVQLSPKCIKSSKKHKIWMKSSVSVHEAKTARQLFFGAHLVN